MKKIFATLCMALTAAAMMAQQPVITFEKTEHDFGQIQEADGRVSTVFNFKNEGMAPLVLSNVRASCGCTTPTWTKEPIEPGQTGSITVTYNPNGRPGKFQKTVTITSNATEATTRVYIKGEVIPKQAKQENKYNIAVGDLSMKSKELNLGIIKKGTAKQGELEYANLTQAAHSVELATSAADSYLSSQVSLETANPNQIGQFIFLIDTKQTKLYGPVEAYAYVVVDKKKNLSETYRLTIRAEIEEDFSTLSVADRQQAPIIEVGKEINLGTVAKGKVAKGQLAVKNIGVNPLQIRRAYSHDKDIVVVPCKAVKSGKKGAIALEINTKNMQPGAYQREIVILSNDYEHPKQKVIVKWTVK